MLLLEDGIVCFYIPKWIYLTAFKNGPMYFFSTSQHCKTFIRNKLLIFVHYISPLTSLNTLTFTPLINSQNYGCKRTPIEYNFSVEKRYISFLSKYKDDNIVHFTDLILSQISHANDIKYIMHSVTPSKLWQWKGR